jgi:hypothetical protein
MSNPPPSALIEFIEDNHKEYYGKILELRREVEEWLAYIPNTFQHYTTHTIKHSDEIVKQISNLLFNDDDCKPVIKLSGVEAYILVAAAYLHDAGMVTSEKEKSEILETETWKKWISAEESRAQRWSDIQFQREENPAVADPATRNFLADLQTRFMIAEFIRGQHHIRAGNVIELHHDKLGRIDFGSAMLRDAIAQVCVGHGLRQHELEDNERFPELRDIRDEKVNLRFLAILLRLGDLLDMSETRACPLLLNAASPLPPDSMAHWSQYKAIKHRLTSPEVIEVTAKCRNQDEDRVLRDWCQWIVEEVQNAKIVMPKARRHKDWQVPDASMEGDRKTIKISPAPDAQYLPSNWQLDFDKQAIFNLLAEDLYKNPMVFVRELVQNALDAIRCKMYSDLEKEGKDRPEYPTQVPQDFRERYSVRLSISEREKANEVSGKTEKEQVLVIEDDGIGMDTEIIEKYFLQVGRSFYKSDEFRRNFQFVPTSRFGIGFLSVFAASNNVTVDSYKPTSEIQDNKPVKITLTGLRNYLLRDKSERNASGTRIELVLRESIEPGELTKMVDEWCRRVEFPIKVDDFGEETIITAETSDQFVFEHQLITNPNAKFLMRVFPVNNSGIEGEIYILAYIDEQGESWADSDSKLRSYSDSHPLAAKSESFENLECFHGIKIGAPRLYPGNYSFRLDFRNKKYLPMLSRGGQRLSVYKKDDESILIDELQAEYEKIIALHLADCGAADTEDFWKYKHALMRNFPNLNYWHSLPETIPVYIDKMLKTISLNDLLEFEEFYSIRTFSFTKPETYRTDNLYENTKNVIMEQEMKLLCLNYNDISFFSSQFYEKLFFESYSVSNVDWISDNYVRICWSKKFKKASEIRLGGLIDFGREDLFTIAVGDAYMYGKQFIFNKSHWFQQWLSDLINALNTEQSVISEEMLQQLYSLFNDIAQRGSSYTMKNLRNYIEGFKSIPNLPIHLQPPDIEITYRMFGFEEPEENE